jgi:GntR family transcriptional regulator / MocR family aminotransferase
VHLHEKVFQLLRGQILDGQLPAGERLLPSRVLARHLEVSRNTVLVALERLSAEGYIVTRGGSGSYVNDHLQLPRAPSCASVPVPRVGFVPYRTDIIDFRSGVPELTRFPVKRWAMLYKDVMAEITPRELGYGPPEGHPGLRREIAGYLRTHRGVGCEAEQILITSGTTQAIGIAGHLLCAGHPDPSILLEDPITVDIRLIFQQQGARIHSVPTDREGLCTDALPENLAPQGIYVTPSHQYPMGTVLSAARRVQLLTYAQGRGSYIIEDDYDSEYRYAGPPLSTFQGMCPDRVVYIGTFSKTLCPGLRIGYLVLPPGLIYSARNLKWHTDLHNSIFDQLVLARFIRGGYYYRHLLQMKKLYKSRRDHLLKCLGTHQGNLSIKVVGADTGLHLCVRYPGIIFSPALLSELERNGVRVYPVSAHATDPSRYMNTVILGFGMLTHEKIEEGVALLHHTLSGSPRIRNRM